MKKLTRKERDKIMRRVAPKLFAAMQADAEAKRQLRLIR